jgi:hypothetical protein
MANKKSCTHCGGCNEHEYCYHCGHCRVCGKPMLAPDPLILPGIQSPPVIPYAPSPVYNPTIICKDVPNFTWADPEAANINLSDTTACVSCGS